MDFDHPPADPIRQIEIWLEEAGETGLPNPTAMALATVDGEGRPSLRMVLLKGLDRRGAVFYTNRRSRKGLELAANPAATGLLHCDPLHRQIAIEGTVTLVDDSDSDAYFRTRARESQLAAWASRQSEPVESRAALDAAFAEMEERFAGGPVPRPPDWGGYRLSLDSILFWQARPHRLHDRIVYRPDGRTGWTVQRLFP